MSISDMVQEVNCLYHGNVSNCLYYTLISKRRRTNEETW